MKHEKQLLSNMTMKNFRYGNPELFEAFIKSAQYLVRLKTQEDIWEHLGKFITTHFPADWTALVRRDSVNGISLLHCTLPDAVAAQHILTEEVRTHVEDVLNSGFLSSQVILMPAPSITAFLPVVEEYPVGKVMLIGHETAGPLPKELLNIYLAIVGLAGTTFERLHSERELNMHRSHLEELVKQRTSQLEAANAQLQTEITERKRSEAILSESESRLKKSQEIAQLGSWELDLVNNHLSWSDEAYRIFGLQPQEFAATYEAFLEAVHPDDRPSVDAAYSSSLREGRDAYEIEHRVVRKSTGEVRIVHEKCEHVRDESGRIIRSVGMVHDITERKKAEEEINSLNEELSRHVAQLEAANKELEAFSYSVSHDLRAPLRHLTGFSELLVKRAGQNLDEKSREYLKVISNAAMQMGRLIDDLLSFSRAGRVEMKRDKVDLNALVRRVVRELDHETQGRDVDWEIRALPMISGDPTLLRLVWTNLISNALKFTRSRTRAVIEIGAGDGGSEYVFHIKDNGVGFDMKYKDKLFGLFQRLHRQEEFEGTGVGLANVQRIIHRHGGKVWAEGVQGEGATFFFALPKQRRCD